MAGPGIQNNQRLDFTPELQTPATDQTQEPETIVIPAYTYLAQHQNDALKPSEVVKPTFEGTSQTELDNAGLAFKENLVGLLHRMGYSNDAAQDSVEQSRGGLSRSQDQRQVACITLEFVLPDVIGT